MDSRHLLVPLLLAAVIGGVGCATGGGDQFKNAVYDTHRRVASLDTTLGGSVNKLNENVAGLVAQMETSDRDMKVLQSTVEENTVKLSALEKKVDALSSRVYRSLGLSSPAGPPASGAPSEVVPNPQQDVQAIPPGVSRVPSAPEGVSALTAPVAPVPAPAPTLATPAPAAAVPARTPAASATAAPSAPTGSNPEADYQQAQKSYASENYAAALDQFSGYLQRYPNSENTPNAQFWKAKSLQNLERYEEAVSEFEKLRVSYPNSVRVPYAMLYQGLCHARLGQTARAGELLQDVIRNYPMTPAADQAKSELKKLRGN
jgi:tol-pal system protein YbgF